MRIRVSVLCLGAAVAMLLPRAVAGQDRPVELGLDMGLALSLTNEFNGFEQPNVTQLAVPNPVLRVGIFASDMVSIEPSLQFQLLKFEGSDAFYSLSPSLGVLIHFSPDRTRSQVYARPFAGADLVDPGSGDSQSQFHAGAGIGVKLPVGDKLAARLEAAFAHLFKSEDDGIPGANQIGVLIGFSFFTK